MRTRFKGDHSKHRPVQQVVQQWGRNRAVRGCSPRAHACGNSENRASSAAFRKPPVGSSSLPVGSENLGLAVALTAEMTATADPSRLLADTGLRRSNRRPDDGDKANPSPRLTTTTTAKSASVARTSTGRCDGPWEFFRRDGSRMRSGSFERGKQIGVWRTFDRTGRTGASDRRVRQKAPPMTIARP